MGKVIRHTLLSSMILGCCCSLMVTGALAQVEASPSPGAQVSFGPSADDIYNAGVDLQKSGRYEEAVVKYSDALKKRAVFPDAWLNRGICHLALKQWESALDNFNAYIQRKPNVAIGYINRASAFVGRGQYDTALQDYQTVLQRNPDSRDLYHLYLNRGNLYFLRGDLDRAVSDYTLSIQTGDKMGEFTGYVNRARAYLSMNPSRDSVARADLNNARAAVTARLTQHPNDPQVVYQYVLIGDERERMGDLTGALEDYTSFLQRVTSHPEREVVQEKVRALKGRLGQR